MSRGFGAAIRAGREKAKNKKPTQPTPKNPPKRMSREKRKDDNPTCILIKGVPPTIQLRDGDTGGQQRPPEATPRLL